MPLNKPSLRKQLERPSQTQATVGKAQLPLLREVLKKKKDPEAVARFTGLDLFRQETRRATAVGGPGLIPMTRGTGKPVFSTSETLDLVNQAFGIRQVQWSWLKGSRQDTPLPCGGWLCKLVERHPDHTNRLDHLGRGRCVGCFVFEAWANNRGVEWTKYKNFRLSTKREEKTSTGLWHYFHGGPANGNPYLVKEVQGSYLNVMFKSEFMIASADGTEVWCMSNYPPFSTTSEDLPEIAGVYRYSKEVDTHIWLGWGDENAYEFE